MSIGEPKLTVIAALTTGLLAAGGVTSEAGYCTATARNLFTACVNEVQDDHWVATAICTNVSDKTERVDCYDEAKESRAESRRLCKEQLKWRRQACKSLGRALRSRRRPGFVRDRLHESAAPERLLPARGRHFWEYRGGNEVNTVAVLNETKLIEGVTCVVVNDLVYQDGDLVEDTDDWFAQAADENVWYFGEEVKDFESFDGDNPRKPELVSMDGSFKAGRDGDKPGIIFRASPVVGEAYLEEFSLGNAEDVTEILSTTYSFGSDPELDTYVPQGLAELLCTGDCVVTRNFSLLEPGVVALKYYAAEIGFFLEVQPDDGEILQLVACNFDARCSTLPSP
jgi:hypothetical protein